MDNKKKIIITLLVIALLILVGLIVALFFWPKTGSVPENIDNNNNIGQSGEQAETNLPPSSPDRIKEESSYPLGLKQLAMSFVERYGSYSSDSGSKNLDDLLPFSSDKMIEKIRSSASSPISASTTAEIFQGFTTKALSFSLDELKTDQATVTVNTQRLTYLGPGKEPNISYKNIQLLIVKISNQWKVDDAIWK